MDIMMKFVRAVNGCNEQVGRWIALLILPLIFVVMYEVILRKVFEAPTAWAFEVTVYLYGAHFMLGMAYTLLHDRHVRIDIIVIQFPSKVQLWLRIITFLVIFVPFVGVLGFASVEYAIKSWAELEHSWSAWKPPLYPYKTVMPVAVIMLFFQGVSNFIRDIYRLKGKDI